MIGHSTYSPREPRYTKGTCTECKTVHVSDEPGRCIREYPCSECERPFCSECADTRLYCSALGCTARMCPDCATKVSFEDDPEYFCPSHKYWCQLCLGAPRSAASNMICAACAASLGGE